MVECFICEEKSMRKDFFLHNKQDCFLKDPNNTFSFPSGKNGFYLIGGEVLVDAQYWHTSVEGSNFDVDNVGFNIFGLETEDSLIQPSKMKIVMTTPEDPSFQMEVITAIQTGPYRTKYMLGDHDFILEVWKNKCILTLTFELIYLCII